LDLVDDLDDGVQRNAEKKKISYDIMNELKPKTEPQNFASISKDDPVNIENQILGTQELPQKITSKELIEVSTQNDVNQMGFMNTNGAEISHILKNPNDISQNMTNLDILGMPSGKTNNDVLESESPQLSNKILDNQPQINPPQNDDLDNVLTSELAPNTEPQKPKEDDFKIKDHPDNKENLPDLAVQNEQVEIKDSNVVSNTFEEPGPPNETPKNNGGGFEDIFAEKKPEIVNQPNTEFDDIFGAPETNANAPVQKANENNEEVPKNEKVIERKKSDEMSAEDQYYSPDNYQDTGGYEDDGESNYYQNNYYGGHSDYEEEDDKDYETYKRDDTGKDDKNQKKNDAVDFL
jgi:hypothetical protein